MSRVVERRCRRIDPEPNDRADPGWVGPTFMGQGIVTEGPKQPTGRSSACAVKARWISGVSSHVGPPPAGSREVI